MNDILNALLDPLMEIIGTILLSLLIWASTEAARYFNVKIEEKHMRTVHSALLTGIRAALQDGIGRMGGEKSQANLVNAAVTYALNGGATDAIDRLKISGDTLADLAKSKIPVAMAELAAAKVLQETAVTPGASKR